MQKSLAMAAAVMILSLEGCAQLDQDIETFTVSDKERKCDAGTSSNGGSTLDCYFVIYAEDGRVFKNEDDILSGKFNSATFQARMIVGKSYTVRTTGWRIPLFSVYPNIVEIKGPQPLKGKAFG